MLPFNVEHIFFLYGATPIADGSCGPLPESIRATAYVLGGEADGPRLQGAVLPVGGDWLLLRRDGIGLVDVHLTLQTHDEALIYVTYSGILDLGADGYEKFLAGQMPATFPVRITPRFQTGHPSYRWMNRIQCVGIGEADTKNATVSYDVYAVA